MTAGHGIAHSEMSPPDHPPGMHGLQLWVALPAAARHGEPRFEHHPELPVLPSGVTVLIGQWGGEVSPARVHTPLVAVEVLAREPVRLPLDPAYEYGAVVMSGAAAVAGTRVAPGAVLYLAPGRSELTVSPVDGVRLVLLGGEPFEEDLVMWWNFVGRSHEDIAQARDDWMSGRRFGTVADCTHPPLPAPPMPTVRLKPRGRDGRTT
jgi:quercetin 2,3-dioxygenase